MNIKKIAIITFGLAISVGALLLLMNLYIDKWQTMGFSHRAVAILTIVGWIDIAYKIARLKFKWLRKLAE